MREALDAINSELRILHEKGTREKESNLTLQVIDCLIRLTNTGEQSENTVESATAEPSTKLEDERIVPEKCPPHRAINIYGLCTDCGTCLHTNVKGGFCLTCSSPIEPELPA